MTPAHIEAIAFDGKQMFLPARRVCGIEVPSPLSGVADAVEKSRSILELPDDWDDEGSPGYAVGTWERAATFVLKSAVALWQSEGICVEAPRIHNGPAGSIDIHWKTRGAELLVTVPPTLDRPATYYGQRAETGLETKGNLETSAPSEWLLQWLTVKQSMWPAEEVPSDATLFQRVHRNNLDEHGLPKPGAFRNTPTRQDGMSTDWGRDSTPHEIRLRARNPLDNIVIALAVGKVSEIAGQRVEHTPVQPEADGSGNRAHCDVYGEKSTEARLKFLQIYNLVPEISLDR